MVGGCELTEAELGALKMLDAESLDAFARGSGSRIAKKLQLIALSPHDSGEEAIAAVREAYTGMAKDIRVGQPIAFGQ